MDAGLSIRSERRDGVLCVRPAGEVDATTCTTLGEVLRSAARQGDADLVLDLSGVEFMDSSGLAVLLNAHRRLVRAGRKLLLAVPEDHQVGRLLRTTDLEGTFHLHRSRREALRAAG